MFIAHNYPPPSGSATGRMPAQSIGSTPMQNIRMSFGGDALDEAVAASRLGLKAELISKVGNDEAGKQVLGFLRENKVHTKIKVEDGLETGINIVLIDPAGERRFLTSPAYKGAKVIDTTGAGDSFVAGFLWGLKNKLSLEECARFGCAVASCTVETVGANAAIEFTESPVKRYKKCWNTRIREENTYENET